jgi:hypothetical protein
MNMSDVIEILEQVREHYLQGYRQSYESFSQAHEKSAPEVLLQLQNRDKLSLAYQLYRIDMASGDSDSPNFSEFNHESHLSFSPIQFTANSIEAELHPIAWNAVEFETNEFDINSEVLSDWALKWIDQEEQAESDEPGIGCYIHSITFPELENGKVHFSIDFGSATITSFHELLSVLIEMGVTDLKIHSRTLLEGD